MKFILEERLVLHEEDFLDLSDLPDYEDSDKVAEPETTTLTGEIDWEKEYAKCKTSEDYKKFWKGVPNPRTKLEAGYYKGEWGDKAQTIENLGGYFLTSLTELGWDRDENPFIAFVEDILESKTGTRLELPKTADNNFLTIIFKSFKEHHLKDEDLRGNGKLGRYNLVFNPNFYAQTMGNQEKYLAQQSKLMHNAEKIDGDLQTVWINILDTKGNIKTFDAVIPTSNLSAFREINRVAALVEKVTGVVDDVEATDESIKKALERITSVDEAKTALAYLYDVFGATNYAIIQAVNKANSNSLTLIRNSVNLSAKDSNRFRQIFFNATKYSAATIKQLLEKLLEKSSTAITP